MLGMAIQLAEQAFSQFLQRDDRPGKQLCHILENLPRRPSKSSTTVYELEGIRFFYELVIEAEIHCRGVARNRRVLQANTKQVSEKK
jgi:hypothetical protein